MKEYNIEELEKKLKNSKKMDICDIEINNVEDISERKINRKKNKNERILDFICKVKNPYVLKINNKIVKLEFANNNKNAEDSIINILNKIYE